MGRMRARWLLGVATLFGVFAAVLPLSGAFARSLAASYLTPADCTKTAAAGTNNWSNPATWSPNGVPGATDVVCIPDGATVTVDVSGATVVGIVSDATNAPTGTATLQFTSNGMSLSLSGGASADKASTIDHLVMGGTTSDLDVAKTGTLPTIIRAMDSCGCSGTGDLEIRGGLGNGSTISGTGSPAPTLTLAGNMSLGGTWGLSNRRLVIKSGITLTLQNAGMSLSPDVTIENHGIVTFADDVVIAGDVTTDLFDNASDGLTQKTAGSAASEIITNVVNDGVMTNGSAGTLGLGGSASEPGGISIAGPVSGTGTLMSSVLHREAPLAPGDGAAGNMSITGDYTLVPISGGQNPHVQMELGGTGAGQSDHLSVQGDCTLAGTLDASLLSGYTPALGDVITIMNCASVIGTFEATNLPSLSPPFVFHVVYTANTVELHVDQATAVTLESFTAARAHNRVLLRWRTATEEDLLGFNVYRQAAGKRVKLNRSLVRAKGGVSGASYSGLYRGAPKNARYWLQIVSADGSRRWYGGIRSTGS